MISVVGVSHRTTPIEVREQLALDDAERTALLRGLVETSAVAEALVVSTCNRVEVVVAPAPGSDERMAADVVMQRLLSRVPVAMPHLYCHLGPRAVHHLFRVTASLDSLVVGEPQILGQVKDAFERARLAGTLGASLHRVVTRAIRTAKRVRSETPIGTGQVSVPTVAVDLTRQIFDRLEGRTVMLIGSGEMAEQVARLLRGAGCRIIVLGRTESKVRELAAAVGGDARGLHELRAGLVDADVVVSSTSAPGYVIDRDAVAGARRSRRGRSLFFIDLAVPRDIDPGVESLDGVFLYNIDDLSNVVADALSGRRRGAELAERIVAAEAASFDRWREGAQVTPVVVALRVRFEAVLQREIDKSLKGRLRHLGPADRDALQMMLGAAVNKLLHAPTRRLRQGAMERDWEGPPLEQLIEAVEDLFSLRGDAALEELQSGPHSAPPLDAAGLDEGATGPGEAEEPTAMRDVAEPAPRTGASR